MELRNTSCFDDAEEPLARTGSPYRNAAHFEETMLEAAGRIARWRGLRLQWFVLTVLGVVLIVFTCLKVVANVLVTEPAPFIPGSFLLLAWTGALAWTWLYRWQVSRLEQRIVNRRLCLHCGNSLLEETLDANGIGICPKCCRLFNIADYTPPADCLEALRTTRGRLPDVLRSAPSLVTEVSRPEPRVVRADGCEPPLYYDARHFDRVMNRHARKLAMDASVVLGRRPGWEIGVLVGALPILIAFALAARFPLVGWAAIVGVFAFMTLSLAALVFLVRISVMRCRIVNHRLCLSCGYSLKGARVDALDLGRCPECARRFHTREYIAPGADERNTDWAFWRRALFDHTRDLIERRDPLPERFVPSPDDDYEHQVRSLRRQGHRNLARCDRCGYIISASPTDEHGDGRCSQCGTPFHRELVTTSLNTRS